MTVRVAVARTATTDRRAAARALLRDLVGADCVIASERSGRPYLPQWPRIGVSLSYSDTLVAVAVGPGRVVGVDVEETVEFDPGMARRCGAPELVTMPPDRRARELTRIWTVQEACVKAAGLGLRGSPWTVPVGRALHGSWRGLRWISRPGREFTVSCAFGPMEGEET
ncbi:4'-phosphopantetheinyl transferase superfamily protein [Lentzea sp. NPDC005914]|uniref:4'-phosphopantetheinyl transferase family protein n=1 Tax=Lentzea sp. NPDC005914 TaxID=3154572 RepID=UPI0033EC7575